MNNKKIGRIKSEKIKFRDEEFYEFIEIEHRNLYTQHSNKFEKKDKIIYDQIKKIKNKIKILDIGFGDGRLLKKICKLPNTECYGLDCSKKNVEFTQKELGSNVKLFYGSVADMSIFNNEFFDVIFVCELLEHLTNQELSSALKEINRIFKPSGMLVVSTPLNEDLRRNTKKCPECGAVFNIFGHKQSFNEKKLISLLNKYKFKPFKIMKSDDIPHYISNSAETFFRLWKRLWRIKKDVIMIFAQKM